MQVIATTEPAKPEHISYENVTIPMSWVTGSILATLAFLLTVGSVLWNFSAKQTEQKNKIEKNAEAIAALQRNLRECRDNEKAEHKSVKGELEACIANAIEKSQQILIYQINLLSQKMEMSIKTLSDGQAARNQTLNKLVNRQEALTQRQLEIEGKLNSIGIPFHSRYRDGDVPSSPGNYG